MIFPLRPTWTSSSTLVYRADHALKKDWAKVKLSENEKTQLASAFPEPTVSHIMAADAMVRHVKTSPIRMVIHSIEADSSFDTSGRERSQHGWLLGFTSPWLNQGREAPVSLMQWRSKRLRRKAASSLLCKSELQQPPLRMPSWRASACRTSSQECARSQRMNSWQQWVKALSLPAGQPQLRGDCGRQVLVRCPLLGPVLRR